MLPPISTTGLTPADVAELAERTRETMLAALKEISVPVDARESTPKPEPAPVPSPTLAPAPAPEPAAVPPSESSSSAPESESIVDVREILPEGKSTRREDVPAAMQRSITGSESEATDEDMVVVDRP